MVKRSHKRKVKFSFFTLVITLCCSFANASLLNDKGLISETSVYEEIPIHQTDDIIRALQKAKLLHKSVAISAKQHSQGGQTLIQGGIVLNMLPYNHVLKIDEDKTQVTVEPGITWDGLQKAINPHHLAIGVMQSSNIFTVGGSMSVNAHGLDFRLSPMINSIVSFHMVLANGKIVEVSPDKNSDLWRAAIGGYGLVGVISDVTLRLMPDAIFKSKIQLIQMKNLNDKFTHDILPVNDNVFMMGRLSTAPGEGFLRDMLLLTFSNTHFIPAKIQKLINPDNVDIVIKPLFNWSRHSDVGKKHIWQLEKLVFQNKYHDTLLTRNNAMRFAIEFAVSHHQNGHADWLQEYYLPPDKMAEFIEYLRSLMIENHVNLLNATIRYVQGDTQSILTYAKNPSFSVVLYFDQELSEAKVNQTKQWTDALITKAESFGGNYYLPYQPFASKAQFQKGYPGYHQFVEIKQKYDRENLFSSEFYLNYF